jgi:glycosyltransferase 2 family protein
MQKTLLLFAKILASAGLLYLALRGIDFGQVRARLANINAGWLAAAAAVALFQLWLGAVRWRDVTQVCGTDLPLARAFRYNFIGAFFNQTLPSAIGGDAVRLMLLGRGGAGWRIATYSVFIDRAIGLIALAVLVLATLPLSWQLILDEKGRYAITLLGLAAIGAGAGFLLLGRLPWPWLDSWFPTRHLRACSTAANQVIFGRNTAPRIAVVSISIHLLAVVMVWMIAQSIVAAGQPEQLLALVPPVMLITMLPISIAGWGLREATMMVAFGYAGLPQADGLTVSLLYGAMIFVVGAAGGLVWILSSEKAAGATIAEPLPEP